MSKHNGFTVFLKKSDTKTPWICCQLGARENYSIPRALHSAGKLHALITDAWIPPGSLWTKLPSKRLSERYHSSLHSAAVHAHNLSGVVAEMLRRRRLRGWDLVIARNAWFQEKVVRQLQKLTADGKNDQPAILFSFSYTAAKPFEFAKKLGWTTVLGQIDCGPSQQELVQQLRIRYDGQNTSRQSPASSYWNNWRKELAMADKIIVNSQWSREHLLKEGVAESKISVIPLAYQPSSDSVGFKRKYPKDFNSSRPLRVLFLGQFNLRKGAMVVLEAMRDLQNEPIEFLIVGPRLVDVPDEYLRLPKVRWIGSVPRGEVAEWYRQADVFLFPTFSDGFGLTQLEAQSWKLPVISSRFCGEVVRDGQNGIILREVTAAAICESLRVCCRDSTQLMAYAEKSAAMSDFSIPCLAKLLQTAVIT